MRVAFLIDVFPRLANTFILNQITGLLDRGVDVDIFGIGRGDVGVLHGDVERYRLLERTRHLPIPKNRGARALSALALIARHGWRERALWDALNVRKYGRAAASLVHLHTVASFLQQEPYDLVHCQFGGLGLTGLDLLRQGVIDGKLVTSFRGSDITTHLAARRGRYRELYAEGDHFLPVSQRFREVLIEEGCAPDKISVHHSGIDLERFAFRERSLGPGERPRLLFIGRLTEKKGVTYAARAVAALVAEGRALDFTIVGDGELRADLEALVTELGVTDNVRLTGWQPQEVVARHLDASHLLLAPSVTGRDNDQEGIPNVVKEAMACGLPVLSTLHSGIPELVDDGVSGFLAPERDQEALTTKLRALVDAPERWPAMGRAGRAKVEAEFDIERLNDELVSLYQTLLG